MCGRGVTGESTPGVALAGCIWLCYRPMNSSLNWLNRCLETPVSVQEADRFLTQAGFPLEAIEPLAGGDVFLDVEITSNRGDCLSHVGLAREIAACNGTRPKSWPIDEPTRVGDVASVFTLDNREPSVCPRFTAQVIKGVKVGKSPQWLVDLLEAVGQRSINNVVDVTNFLTIHFGQPAHVFDLAKLTGDSLVVRFANKGEKLTTLDGKDRTLVASDLVVADSERAQSLAGVIGGFDSQVTDATVDVVLEAACWDPVTIRTASRRLNIRTDASHRFERGVDARTVDGPARFGAAMIASLAGGKVMGGDNDGLIAQGSPLQPQTVVDLRPSRCRAIIGTDDRVEDITRYLTSLEIGVEAASEDLLRCTIPAFRLDLTREIDLVEEVARTGGFDRIALSDKLPIRVTHPQPSERSLSEISRILTGLGFYETVTFSFVSPAKAEAFLDEGLSAVAVDDDRRKAEPTLRPSVLPSLLACRKANQDARVSVAGGVRLFELAAAFAQDAEGKSRERATLALLIDVPGVAAGKKAKSADVQQGVRLMRGAIEAIVRSLAGPAAAVSLTPKAPTRTCWEADVLADVTLDGASIGEMGLLAASVAKTYDLDLPVVCAEIDLAALLAIEPGLARVQSLPAFPGIERDLSVVVDERVAWDTLRETVESARVERLIGVSFVGVYRGKQIDPGKKSVTLRLSFRDPKRTLVHEEIDGPTEAAVAALASAVGAQIRS
jgi:phenylalanyl-tRNA synthetase beta chain